MAEAAVSMAILAVARFAQTELNRNDGTIEEVVSLLEAQNQSLPDETATFVLKNLELKRDEEERKHIFEKFRNMARKKLLNHEMATTIAVIASGLETRCFLHLSLNKIKMILFEDEEEEICTKTPEKDSYLFSVEDNGSNKFIEEVSDALKVGSIYDAIEIIIDVPNLENLSSLTEFEYSMLQAERCLNYEPWGRFDLREDHSRLDECLEYERKCLRIHQGWARIGTVQTLLQSDHTNSDKKIETVKNAIDKVNGYYGSSNVFIVGKSGQGKSTLANKLSERLVFYESEVDVGTVACRRKQAADTSEIAKTFGQPVNIWDTPGISEGHEEDIGYLKKLENVLAVCGKARAMIIVFKEGQRCNQPELDICMRYIDLWGEKNVKNVIVMLNEMKHGTTQKVKGKQKKMWADKLSERLRNGYIFSAKNVVHCNLLHKESSLRALIMKISKFNLTVPLVAEKVYETIIRLNNVDNEEERRKYQSKIMEHSNLVFAEIADKLEKNKIKVHKLDKTLEIDYKQKFFSKVLNRKALIQRDVINIEEISPKILKVFRRSLGVKKLPRYVFKEITSHKTALIKIGGTTRVCFYEMFPINRAISDRILEKITEYLKDPDVLKAMAMVIEEMLEKENSSSSF